MSEEAQGGMADGAEEVSGGLADGGNEGGSSNPANGAGAGSSWYQQFSANLDEDMRPDFEKHASRYKSERDFAKSYVELRKGYDQRVPLPQSPAELSDFYQKHGNYFGIPSSPDEYEAEVPDDVWDDVEKSQIEEYKKVAHRTGRSKDAFKEDIKFLSESQKIVNDAKSAKAQKSEAKNRQALKNDWGFQFEENVAIYSQTVDEFAQEDKEEFLSLRLADGTLAQNHPVIAKMMVRAGRGRMEDGRDLNSFNRTARMGAMAQLEDMERKLDDKYGSQLNWPKEDQIKVQQLYDKVYGSEPKAPHHLYGRQRNG